MLSKVFYFKESLLDIFNSRRYQRLNPYQKENILIRFFHFTNFYNIKTDERAILLQEFENVHAKTQRRSAYKIVVVSQCGSFNELIDMETCHSEKKIRVCKNVLYKGSFKEGSQEIPYLNLFILNSLLHEGYHNYTRECIYSKYNHPDDLVKEHKEQLIFMGCDSFKYQDILKSDFCLYRMIPDEYYAFLYSYTKINEYMRRLSKIYGVDPNFDKYLRDYKLEIKFIENLFKVTNNRKLTAEEIYQFYLEKMLLEFAENTECNIDDYKESLKNSKSLIKSLQ